MSKRDFSYLEGFTEQEIEEEKAKVARAGLEWDDPHRPPTMLERNYRMYNQNKIKTR